MISYVEITNFLSWESAYIPLGPLTVVAGPNLSGKSSIARAVSWCLLNDGTWSDDPIRDTIRRQLPDGSLANEVVVTVGFSDGRKVTRRRSAKPNINMYTMTHPDGVIDEIPSGSVGAGFCQSVGDFTGVKPTVWPDKSKTCLQMSNDAIEGRFLLSDSTGAVDSKLGVVIGVDVLETATKKASSIAISAGRKVGEIQRDIASKQGELSRYDGLEIAIAAHRRAVDARLSYQAISGTLSAVKTHTAALASHVETIEKLAGLPEKLDALVTQAEKSADDAKELRRKCLTAEALLSKLTVTGPTPEVLSRVSEMTDAAEALVESWRVASELVRSAQSLAQKGTESGAAHHKYTVEIEAIDEELGILLSTIQVCPVDDEAHQLCPFWSGTTEETV